MDFLCFYFPLFCIHWLMGYDLLPTDPAWYAYHFWTDPVGVLTIAKMGGSLGKMAHTLSDRTLLWSYAILRGIISLCNSLIISVVILQNTST